MKVAYILKVKSAEYIFEVSSQDRDIIWNKSEYGRFKRYSVQKFKYGGS